MEAELCAHRGSSLTGSCLSCTSPSMHIVCAPQPIIALSVCSLIHVSHVLFTCFIFHFMSKLIARLTPYHSGLVLFIPFKFHLKSCQTLSLHFYKQNVFTRLGLSYVQLEHTFQQLPLCLSMITETNHQMDKAIQV